MSYFGWCSCSTHSGFGDWQFRLGRTASRQVTGKVIFMNRTKRIGTGLHAGWLLTPLLVLVLAGPPVAQADGPVSWWRAEGDAMDAADGNHGTLEGDTTFAPGQVGFAFSLDGDGDLVQVPDNDNLRPAHVSMAAWINTSTIPGPGIAPAYIVARSGDNGKHGYELSVNYPRPDLGLGPVARVDMVADGDNAFGTVLGTSNVADGAWHHVVGTYDEQEIKVYVDCRLEGTKEYTAGLAYLPGDPLRMGTRDRFSNTSFFNGLIDEAKVYNRALSKAEVVAMFEAESGRSCGVVTVEIDIKPGSFPNGLNPGKKGKTPVAIQTTDTFDATTVDPTTVRFGATGTEAAPLQYALEDWDRDGDTDLVLHFDTPSTGIACGDTSAFLTGETFDGQAIQGSDSVKTAGCK